MTETLAPMNPAELAGKTRAELLEMCRERGLAATAWKKERMERALLTGEVPGKVDRVKKTKDNALAQQLAARRQGDPGALDAERRKIKEQLELHNGPCQSKNGCKCEAWAPGGHDAFHWPICGTCTHTRHAHAKIEACHEPSGSAEAAATSEP